MFSIETLLRIRRKVDKATKRADALQAELRACYRSSEMRKYELGDVLIPASALVGCHDDNMGCDLGVLVCKGDYSPIYPASIGRRVDYLQHPFPVCTDADEARYTALYTRDGKHEFDWALGDAYDPLLHGTYPATRVVPQDGPYATA